MLTFLFMLRTMISILHRFAHFEAAKRAIQELDNTKPPGFKKKIIVELAPLDIGDICNGRTNKICNGRTNKFTPSRWSRSGSIPASNRIHFNENMCENFLRTGLF